MRKDIDLNQLPHPMITNKHNTGDFPLWLEIYLSLGKKELSVLEWGGGRSTIWFPIWLHQQGIECTWDTIEGSEEWGKYIREEALKYGLDNVNLIIEKRRHEYGTLPLSFGKKYDVIIVDGDHRKFCLKRAHLLLKQDGIIIVHDANWFKRYLDSIQYFDGKYIGTRTWVAKFKN